MTHQMEREFRFRNNSARSRLMPRITRAKGGMHSIDGTFNGFPVDRSS